MNALGRKPMKWSLVLAAISGGTVAAVVFDGQWQQKVWVLIVGSLSSLFVTPFICARIGVDSADSVSFCGFLTAVIGYSFVKVLVRFVETRSEGFMASYLGKLLGVEVQK